MGGFLGSKEPNPPAITTTGALCCVPLLVVTTKEPSSNLSNVSALSPNVKPGSKGLICSIRLSTKVPAKISGNAGIS